MDNELRRSGIACIGHIPWGTHLCQFYESKDDLADLLVSYFRAGLEANEFCMWITSEPLTAADATAAAQDAIPDFDRYLQQGQIEIVSYSEWYLQAGRFDPQRVLDAWIEKLRQAQRRGYDGLRLSGNTFWLEREGWDEFVAYEEQMDRLFAELPMIALCSYSLERCRASDVLDVIRHHRFAIIRQSGRLQLVESSELRRARSALRESEARFRRLTENAPDIIFRYDLRPRPQFSYISPASTRILGFSPEELYADPELALRSVREDDRAMFRRLLAGDFLSQTVVIGHRHKEGHPVWLEVSTVPIHDASGDLVGIEGVSRDVTERQLAEEGLRETRNYLEKLFNYANAPIIVWDPDFKITRFNHAFERLTGHSADEVIGRKLEILFPETSRRESLAKIARTLSGEYWESVEIPILRKDGDVRLALWNSANIYAGDGKTLLATIAQGQDITERKRAEEALRESEERYRLLVDGAKGYAIFMLDPQGRVASWGTGAERVNGYLAEEVLGQPVSIFYTVEDIEAGRPERELAAAAEEGRCEKQGWRVRRDGSRFWADTVTTALHDAEGRLRGYSSVTRDVTERKLAEEQLRKLSRAVEQSPATVVITDTTGSIEYVNPRFTQLTGYTAEEAFGQNPRILKSGETPPEEYKRLWDTITAGGEWRGEFHNRKKNGELYWEYASISPIRDGDGNITHFLAVKEDITERKRAEDEIRKLNGDLTRRALELDAINRELESFSYSVSHDLRAPLRAIDGFSQALLDDYHDRLDEQGRHYLQRIRSASDRMDQLIDDMLSLARVTRSEMHREDVNLSAQAEAIAAELRRTQPERQVAFIIQPGVVAHGDARLLRVVLENLMENAWKFTSKHPTARIEFGVAEEGGEKVYFVSDDGAGFDMAYADKLFGAFQRLHAQTEFPGTGIGLATVQRIVHRHGGRIWARGEVEKGAEFYFTL
ncbi:MAG: PAS domain S-box protein [Sphingomonadaceae bacterium]